MYGEAYVTVERIGVKVSQENFFSFTSVPTGIPD